MKKLNIIVATLLYVATCFPPTGGLWGACQTVCTGDSVILTLSGYNGTIQWQQSPDLTTWSPVSGVTAVNDTFGFAATSTYYYRAAVTDGDCLPFYSDTTLVTVVNTVPAAPTANATSDITQSSFFANWTASSNATAYYLDVATDAGFTSFVSGYNDLNVGNVGSYSVTGLACNTTYYYRVRAANLCGTSGNSGTINVITSAATLIVPTANAASNIAQSSFSANWTASSGATTYYLDIATDAGFTSFVSGYSNRNVGNVTTDSVTGLDCNSTYYYRVRAANACETSVNSNSITVTTTSATPADPTANTASNIVQASFDANWTTSSDASSYYLDVATDAGFTSFVSGYNDLDVGNVGTYSVTGLNCNTNYHYRVRGSNVCGVGGNSGTIDVTTSASTPAAPTANAASSIAQTTFVANWAVSSNASTYYLDVATDNGFASFVSIYDSLNVGNVTTYSVSGLACGATYYYRIRASNACGTSISSNTITVTTSSVNPTVPSAKAASAVTQSSFYANWSASSAASKYYLDVSTNIDFLSFVPGYADLEVGNDTSYNVTGLACDSTYYYRVRANNPCSTSSNSSTISTTVTCATTPYCTINSTCSGDITDSRDGTYKTIQIVNQCWMAENLNVGIRVDGSVNQTSGPDNKNASIQKYCYGNDPANCNIYGGLYQWDEMMAYSTSINTNGPGPQGICPTGWHIPTDNEWKCLEMNLGMLQSEADKTSQRGTDEGGKLKQTGTMYWTSPNIGATNSSGFTALPGGYRLTYGSFVNGGYSGYWWSGTENSGPSAWARNLYNSYPTVNRGYTSKANGYSVRCVKD